MNLYFSQLGFRPPVDGLAVGQRVDVQQHRLNEVALSQGSATEPTISRIFGWSDSTAKRMPDSISFLNSRSSVVNPNTGRISLEFADAFWKMFSSIVAKYNKISIMSPECYQGSSN